MRGRMTGAFFIGMAAGMLFLMAALWWSGGLKIPAVHAGSRLPATSAGGTGIPAPEPPANASLELPPPILPSSAAETGPAPAVGSAGPHLAMPIADVDPAKITDTFSDMRDGRKHDALDIPAPRGTPVLAVAEGNVVKLFTSREGGLTVYQFDDSKTYSYYYAHLDRYAKGLKEGTLLRKGEVLGYVGSTGNASASAPHLHFAVNKLGPDKKWWEGTPLDPLPLLR